MKTKLSEQIFQTARIKGLKPHSITNNCVLNLADGGCIISDNKQQLLQKIKAL